MQRRFNILCSSCSSVSLFCLSTFWITWSAAVHTPLPSLTIKWRGSKPTSWQYNTAAVASSLPVGRSETTTEATGYGTAVWSWGTTRASVGFLGGRGFISILCTESYPTYWVRLLQRRKQNVRATIITTPAMAKLTMPTITPAGNRREPPGAERLRPVLLGTTVIVGLEVGKDSVVALEQVL